MRLLIVLLLAIWAGCADDDFGRDAAAQDGSASTDAGAADLAAGN
jgi:hypothetical protein